MIDSARRRAVAFGLFALWLAVAGAASWTHSVWRDEMRAYSMAAAAPTVPALIRSLELEGHPALWYLLLRGLHAVVATPKILTVLAFLIAAASALLVVFGSPFSWRVQALLLAGNGFLFEYSVLARNYGIGMLLLFLAVFLYKKHRLHGPVLGIVLFLLANTSALGVIMAGGFLMVWLLDVARQRPALPLRVFGWNAAIATLGVGLCLFTIIPKPRPAAPGSLPNSGNPVVDSVSSALVSELPRGREISDIWKAVFLPGGNFRQLIALNPSPLYPLERPNLLTDSLLSLLLFGSTLGLIRRSGAFLAALVSLLGFSLFFTFVHFGLYRHEGLWLVFLIGCYWMVTGEPDRPAEQKREFVRSLVGLGWTCFVVLMAGQVAIGAANIAASLRDGPPYSNSAGLANLIQNTPELHEAVLMSEPECFLESLPYYLSNPTYYTREGRFGSFEETRGHPRSLDLEGVLTAARALHEETKKPVLILLTFPLDPLTGTRIFKEPRGRELKITPDQQRTFEAATQLLQSFPDARTDEKYDVYLLN